MSMLYKTGVFAANTATGNQAVTGVGFTPKALRLFAVPETSDANGTPGNFAVGMTDFTNSRCIAVGVDDNVATTNSATDASTNLLKILLSGTPSTDAIASIVSADSDGFTINWSEAPSSGWQIHYEAWGGTEITNVAVGTWAPTAGTGNKSLSGLGFQPNVVMTASSVVASGASAVTASMGLSAFTAAGQEYGMGLDSTDARTATTVARYWHKAVSLLLEQGGTALLDATCVTLDAGGWTLNFATHFATTYAIYYMAIKGGHWKVGAETTPTTATTKQTSGLGFQPAGVSLFGNFAAASASVTADDITLGIGASSGLSTSRAVAATYSNAINQRSRSGYKAKALHTLNNAGALVHEAELSAWDSDSFTLNHTNTSATAHEFGYIAFGSVSGSTLTQELDVTETTVPKLARKAARELDVVEATVPTLKKTVIKQLS